MGAYVSEVMFWLYRPLTFMLWGGVFDASRASKRWFEGAPCSGPFMADAA